jgi:type I restriction enzyme S subunit
MNSAFGTKHVFQNQGGLAQQHFNVGDMKLVPIPVPDVSEQDAIVARGQTITKVHDELQDALNKLRRLKSGLMHDLLTGTVPVTPLLFAPSKVI